MNNKFMVYYFSASEMSILFIFKTRDRVVVVSQLREDENALFTAFSS